MSSPNSTLDYASPVNPPNLSAIQLSVVLLKLMGVWQIVGVLQWVPYLASVFTGNASMSQTPLWAVLISPILSLVIGFVLIAWASSIARKLFGEQRETGIDIGPAGWMTIIISGVGLYLIVNSIETAVRSVWTLGTAMYQNVNARTPRFIYAPELFQALSPLLLVALGFVLFLRPRWLLGWWQRKAQL